MNARRFNFQFAALPVAILKDHDAGELRDVDLVIVSKLIGKFRSWLIHEHDDVLAELCGVGKSTFKACMKRLRKLGRIRSVKATVRGFRRALSMTWLAPSEESQQPLLKAESEATAVAPEGLPLRPETEVPPDPPIEEPERRTDDDDSLAAVPVESLGQSSSSPSDEPRKAKPEEVAAVVDLAAKLFPTAARIGDQVKDQARLCREASDEGGLNWVAAALEGARRQGAKSFGYVLNTLRTWRTQGYATPTVAPPPRSQSFAASLAETQRRERLKEINSPPEPAPPTESEIEDARRWIEGTDPQLKKLGRWILGRAEGLTQ